ncbi:MAG TPA: NAD-dependent protein deacylase [Clostridia bacterium]|nr:NAD-dependent protein deacylase [Clostridia bacterium]
MNEKIKRLKEYIAAFDNIVLFGGAGVSTESGIPDFRSADGLYCQQYKYPPEYMLSHTCFMAHTEEFFAFYRDKMLPPPAVKPNAAHRYLAYLEEQGKLKAVITQNIDGLHQAAGSKNVIELHGSVWRNYCMRCGKYYETDLNKKGVPRCSCGGIIKPDVVLYEENLDNEVLEKAIDYISRADMLIIGGTSLVVYPAAGLVRYFNGDKLVIINKSTTCYDTSADLVIDSGIANVFESVWHDNG